jgi:hypothetical protein
VGGYGYVDATLAELAAVDGGAVRRRGAARREPDKGATGAPERSGTGHAGLGSAGSGGSSPA